MGNLIDSAAAQVADFAGKLAGVSLPLAALAVAVFIASLALRMFAWQGTLRAAYPENTIRLREIAPAFLLGNGLNALLPAKAGDAARVVMARKAVPDSSYAAMTSSIVAEVPVDFLIGMTILAVVVASGQMPMPTDLLPTGTLEFLLANPLLSFGLVMLAVSGGILLARKLRGPLAAVIAHLRQGLAVFHCPYYYLRRVAAPQAGSWVLRLASIALFLAAFGIPVSLMAVFAVIAVTGLTAGAGGLGAQQALLVTVLPGAGAAQIVAYSVGQQLLIIGVGITLAALVTLITLGPRGLRTMRAGLHRSEEQLEHLAERAAEKTLPEPASETA